MKTKGILSIMNIIFIVMVYISIVYMYRQVQIYQDMVVVVEGKYNELNYNYQILQKEYNKLVENIKVQDRLEVWKGE